MALNEKYKLSKNRLRALFALSSRSAEDKGDCPDLNDLAAFMDGGLTAGEREAVMAHLDKCPACYNEWLAASAALSRDEGTYEGVGSDSEGAVEEKIQWYGGRRSMLAYGLAIAACLILVFWLPMGNESHLPSIIKKQYQMVLQHKLRPGNSEFLTGMAGHENRSILRGYGFVQVHNSPSPAARAFVSGIGTGWAHIQGKAAFPESGPLGESQWDDYYALGLWYALITSVCGSEEKTPDRFWETQTGVIETFERKMSSRLDKDKEAVVIKRSLERLRSIFSQPQKNDPRTCRSVQLELKIIVQGITS